MEAFTTGTAGTTPARRLVVMGPSGSGKTAVGAALAVDLGFDFVDADDLHPTVNVDKMAAGIPLVDDDRMPWLDVVGQTLAARHRVAVACSALARRYRDRIRRHAPDAVFAELWVPTEDLRHRMRMRSHFMPPALLDSQLSVLEHLQPDEAGVRVQNTGGLVDVVHRAREALEARNGGQSW